MIKMPAGAEIYNKSILIIDSILKDNSHFANSYSENEKAVIKRVIHATGNPGYASSMFFTRNAVGKSVSFIKKNIIGNRPVKIVCDSEMTRAGISKNVNKDVLLELICYIGHEFKDTGMTRSALSIRLAITENLPDFIVIGNAPTALNEAINICKSLNASSGYRPETIIGMPVGFVGAAESKKALFDDNFFESIGNFGNSGGSPAAASSMNALLSLS